MTTTVQMPRETRSVEVRPNSFNEAAHTIDLIWTTGAAVRRYSYDEGPYDEVLEVGTGNVRLGRLNAGAPFLNAHASGDLSQVIGCVVSGSAKIVSGRGLATILLSRAAGDADIIQKIRDGVIRNISVGYTRYQIEKTEGRDGVAIWRVTDWEPAEISAVPIPADPGAQTRSTPVPQTFPCLVRSAADRLKPGSPASKALARMQALQQASGARQRMHARARMMGLDLEILRRLSGLRRSPLPPRT